MRKKQKKWLYVLLWALLIFIFSSQSGQESNNNNMFVVYIFNLLGINLNSVFGELTHFIIRKAAHMTEYFILFYLLFNAIIEETTFNKCIIYSLIATFLYACTDEFHQYFVPGRGPAFRDVLIDTGGGVIAAVTKFIMRRTRNKDLNRYID